MKYYLRPIARSVLRILVKITLFKHKPEIVAIIGSGQTSIAREVIYTVLKEKYPNVRRNLETPEAEFSVPLTILGYPSYPENFLEWFFTLIKLTLQTLLLKPHKHLLVLELSSIHQEIQNYWIQTIKPKTTVEISYDLPSKDYLRPFFKKAKEVAKEFNLSKEEIKTGLNRVILPTSKIRFFKGKNRSFIVDASHYYFPAPLDSVLEIVRGLEGRKIAYAKGFEKNALKELGFRINPSKYKPKKNDVVVVRGQKMKINPVIKELIS